MENVPTRENNILYAHLCYFYLFLPAPKTQGQSDFNANCQTNCSHEFKFNKLLIVLFYSPNLLLRKTCKDFYQQNKDLFITMDVLFTKIYFVNLFSVCKI